MVLMILLLLLLLLTLIIVMYIITKQLLNYTLLSGNYSIQNNNYNILKYCHLYRNQQFIFKVIYLKIILIISLLCLHCTLNDTTYCIDLHHIHGYNDLGQHLNSFKQLKIWNNTLLIIMKMIKKWLDCIEQIINLIGIYDPLVIPTCYGSLFQELVNLSHVIDRKEKPQIIEEPKSAITIVGQSVLFVCLVEGNPAPKVQWKVSGTSVSESRFGKTFRAPRGSILRVNNALPIYNGAIITCTATNALGQAESSATLTVIADESNAPPGYPRFLNSFSVIVARKNAEVELECRATGDPMPEITWFKDSVPIDLSNPRYKKL
ncbi:Receptor-type tyrosine-protein phosphatase F, partial [Schistosoma japonicum]